MAVQSKIYSLDEFESYAALPQNRERLLELINGELVEKMPTQEHGAIVAWIVTFINLFLMENPIGIVSVETRHHAQNDQENVLIPDISFVKDSTQIVREGAVPRMPNLAVEIKSLSNTYIGLRDKAAYYLENGAQMVWLVYPEQRMVEIYHAGADLQILTGDASIDGGDVLPGFSLPINKIFSAVQE